MAGKFVDVTLRLIDKMSAPLNAIGGKLAKSNQQWTRAGKQIEKTGKSISAVGSSMTKSITVPVLGAGTACVKLASDFEAGMSKVQSIAGITGSEMDKLSQKAKEMGAKTKFSAKEATQAYEYMAMAGWKAKDMMDGIEGVMYLAGATGEDLALVSDIVTDGLTAFGMSAKDTEKFVNVLAKTASNSNTNVAMLGESFQYAAPVAGALGYNVQDVSTALGLMANSGIKASSAGTSLRSWMSRMSAPTDAVANAMNKLGISMTDSEGNMKDFRTLMEDTRKGFSKLSETQKAQYASTLAGKSGMSGLLAIVNSSDKDFDKLSKSIYNSNGACKDMYKVANNNLQGQLTILKSTVQSLAISFGERLAPYVKQLTTYVQKLAEKFNGLSDKQKDMVVKTALAVAAVGPMISIFGKSLSTIGRMTKAVGSVGKTLKTLGGNAKAAKAILATIKMPNFSGVKIPSRVTNIFSKLGGGAKNAISPINSAGSAIIKSLGGAAGKVMSPFKSFGSVMLQTASKSKVLTTASSVTGKTFNLFGTGLKKLYSPFTRVGGLVGKLGKSLFTFLGPTGTAIAVIGALVVAGVLLYKNWDKVKKMAGKVFKYIGSVFKACGVSGQSLKKELEPIGIKFNQIGTHAKKLWSVMSPVFMKIGEIAKLVFGVIFGAQIGIAIGVISNLFTSVTKIVGGILKIFDGLIKFITGVFTGNWKQAWSGIKEIFSGVFQSLVNLCKMPINGVISIINGAIAGINKLNLKIPDWVPKIGGQKFGINIPTIPKLAVGTNNWKGGIVQISERGGEIVDLPKGSRVYPHDKSVQKAYNDGAKIGGGRNVNITIPKLADSIIVREDADIDKIVNKLADKLEKVSMNIGGGDIGYSY